MPTVCFPRRLPHGPEPRGRQLHGFLSYLMRCTVTGDRYTVYRYGGKQVRDNIHSADLVRAFAAFHASPRAGAVYNIGGGRENNCSMLEAIDALRAGSPDVSSTGSSGRTPRSATIGGGSATSPRSSATIPAGASSTACRRILGRSTSQRRELDGCRRMKLSIVIPAHNEAGSIGATLTDIAKRLDAEGVDYEIARRSTTRVATARKR